MAPVTVFMSEEIYQSLGAKESVHTAKWLEWDENLARTSAVTLILQVNGKLRDKVEVAQDLPKEELEQIALKSEKVLQFTQDKQIVKVIVVPNKLVNIVVK